MPIRIRADRNAILLQLTGLIALLNVPFRHFTEHAHDLVPFNLLTISRYASIFIGIGLLYLSAQIGRRKRSAYLVAVTAMGLLLAIELLRHRDIMPAGLYAATLVVLLVDRRQYVVRTDMLSLRRAAMTASTILLALAVFAGTLLRVINHRNFGLDLSGPQTVNVVLRALAGLPLPDYVHLSHLGEHVVGLLHLAAISAALFIGYSLFQPLRLRRPPTGYQRRRASAILARYSASSEDYFKLWPEDKHYYFYGDSVVAYAVKGSTALVLDGATGSPDDSSRIRPAFVEDARRNGWTVAVVHADEAERAVWQELGCQSLFIGSEAVVSCAEFISDTAGNKHFRYIRNSAEKSGLSFEYWTAPLTPGQVHQLQVVSDAWLGHGGRREYRFTMGYFDAAYLARCDVAIVIVAGRPIAYANIIPSYLSDAASIDHMRFLPDVPPASMHYLLMQLIKRLYEQGIQTFNLGLVPLSRLEEQPETPAAKRFLGILKIIGSRYYSIRGLEQFKGKFQPDWQPRYLLYSGTAVRLPAIAAALGTATAYKVGRSRRRSLLLVAAAVSAIGYCAFPLAYFLNRPAFWQGLVSGLAEPGQPYDWVFNGLDILSAVLGTAVFLYLYVSSRRRPRLLRASLLLAAIASASDFLTAVVALPKNFDTTTVPSLHLLIQQPVIVGHGLASFINSGAFVMSLACWTYYARKQPRLRAARLTLLVVIVLMVTVANAVGHYVPASAATFQRLFILGYGVWLYGLAAYATQSQRTAKRV